MAHSGDGNANHKEDDKINLAAKLALLDQPYRPGVVGFVNHYNSKS